MLPSWVCDIAGSDDPQCAGLFLWLTRTLGARGGALAVLGDAIYYRGESLPPLVKYPFR